MPLQRNVQKAVENVYRVPSASPGSTPLGNVGLGKLVPSRVLSVPESHSHRRRCGRKCPTQAGAPAKCPPPLSHLAAQPPKHADAQAPLQRIRLWCVNGAWLAESSLRYNRNRTPLQARRRLRKSLTAQRNVPCMASPIPSSPAPHQHQAAAPSPLYQSRRIRNIAAAATCAHKKLHIGADCGVAVAVPDLPHLQLASLDA
eukprot:CAMPEP_0117577896 /NCGR_PEP_ID=MMETSP0784-20121206/63677_1 /TAXON_ID=39447 /ORGANISM="" /LENGTH=200 /DNA_ID=CAMNT_0005377449 /DNA_START=419 /DNA_END=1020 /DNA_ORIENTATION=-